MHLESQARRGNADAIALLTPPPFPPGCDHLFDYYAEFVLWLDGTRAPTWADWHGWATLMRRPVTPFDLRALRRIHDAYHSAPRGEAS